ncbi:MAG: hypothetical protein WCS83_03555 [Endomicrobiia bacterium]|nr:hypothetical protein [Endomicrobiaceae bacterium]MDD3923399.1 hypothetical protein [Endomicrobiaceae bacterium]
MSNINIDVNLRLARDLNKEIKEKALAYDTITLKNVFGQRYIGCGISEKVKIIIEGVPGNDLAAYMDGPEIEVLSNAQDAIGNTMNKGRIIVHGSCGDTAGYAMRGGEIFIRDNVGYRVGIHMKEYLDMKPVIVVGGVAGDFLGEYMAGGIIIVLGLGLSKGEELTGKFCGTGMHGGIMYINGIIPKHKLGKEVRKVDMEKSDLDTLAKYVKQYKQYFKYTETIDINKFSKYMTLNKNPYNNMYTKY